MKLNLINKINGQNKILLKNDFVKIDHINNEQQIKQLQLEFTLQSFKNIDDNLKSAQKKSHLMTETENLQKHLKMTDWPKKEDKW